MVQCWMRQNLVIEQEGEAKRKIKKSTHGVEPWYNIRVEDLSFQRRNAFIFKYVNNKMDGWFNAALWVMLKFLWYPKHNSQFFQVIAHSIPLLFPGQFLHIFQDSIQVARENLLCLHFPVRTRCVHMKSDEVLMKPAQNTHHPLLQ